MASILIIEDDAIIADGLRVTLVAEGYDVTLANDGMQGLHLAKSTKFDLILLDIMMPFMNGFEVTTELRRLGESTPIIILSARNAKRDKVRGLDLGADDYVCKPFDIDELLARIRRRLKVEKPNDIQLGEFTYNFNEQTLCDSQGHDIELTTREQKLLEYFLERPGRIITRTQIVDSVWGDHYEGTDRTVDNFVARLRKKVGDQYIKTVRGQGYRFKKSTTVTRP